MREASGPGNFTGGVSLSSQGKVTLHVRFFSSQVVSSFQGPILGLQFVSSASAAESGGGLEHSIRERNVLAPGEGKSIYLEDCFQDCRSLLAGNERDPHRAGSTREEQAMLRSKPRGLGGGRFGVQPQTQSLPE